MQKKFLIIVILLLIAHALLSSLAIFAKSPTFDEPVHLLGGYTYWKLNDYRINPENGNFPQRWAALPLLTKNNISFPVDSLHWINNKQWFLSFYFFFRSDFHPDSLFIPARFMILILSLALCFSVFIISKDIFGIKGGLISLALCSFSPTILAHSNLVTSDISTTLFFTLSIYFLWKNLQLFNLQNTILSGAALSLLFLSKMSAPIIIPVYLILIFITFRKNAPIICDFRKEKFLFHSQSEKLKAISAMIVFHTAIVYISIWAFYGFRYEPIPEGDKSAGAIALQWDELLPPKDIIEKSIVVADKFQLLPHAYLQGFLYVKKHLNRRLSFLNAQKSSDGFIEFFPYAFAVKTPLPTIILIITAISILILSRHDLNSKLIPFAIFAVIFAIFAITSTINIGHRHILPLYPLFFIFCGCLALPLEKYTKAIRYLTAICIIWLGIETIHIAPHYLAYFNQIIGGPKNAYKHLVDSSLDWGQDLKELAKLRKQLDPEKKTPFYLSYFGTSSINSYGLNDFISMPGYFTQENFKIAKFYDGYYCVSATMLHLLYFSEIFGAFNFPPIILFNDSFEQLQPFITELFSATDKGEKQLQKFLQENGEEFCIKRYRAYDIIRFAKLCEYLKKRKPDYYAGYSILIYKLNENNINEAMKMKVVF